MLYSPHPWARWSILGTALILFTSYFQVQVSVAINSWYGPFYDLVQAALSKSRPVTLAEFYGEMLTFARIALVAVVVGVLTRFFISHYIFRWRTAMNDFYVSHWPRVAHHRRRLAARAGRHHALCDHDGGPRRRPDQFGDDAVGLPAGAGEIVRRRHRAAADRPYPLSAGRARPSSGRCSAPARWR